MNILLKSIVKISTYLFMFIFLFFSFTVFANEQIIGFSEAISQKYADDQSATETFFVSSGPVDVLLVKNGVRYEYTYFPVECADFLLFAGVTTTEIDNINIPSDTVLYDNIMVNVSTSEHYFYTEIENAPYGYDFIDIDTIPKNTTNVLTEGTDGEKEVTYFVKKVGGVIVQKEVIGEEIIVPPINGTAEYGVGGVVVSSDGIVYNYSHKMVFEATAYTYVPGKTTMTTATGVALQKGIVAVDTSVIPFDTEMYIASNTFEYGYGIAKDTGGAIKGNIIDLAFETYDECIQFGRRNITVYFLE